MPKLPSPRKKDFIYSHRRVVEHMRQSDIAPVDQSYAGGAGAGITLFRSSDALGTNPLAGQSSILDPLEFEHVYSNDAGFAVDGAGSMSEPVPTQEGWYQATAFAEIHADDVGIEMTAFMGILLRGDPNQRQYYAQSGRFALNDRSTDPNTLMTFITVTTPIFRFTGDLSSASAKVDVSLIAVNETDVTPAFRVTGMAARDDGSPGQGSARLVIQRFG